MLSKALSKKVAVALMIAASALQPNVAFAQFPPPPPVVPTGPALDLALVPQLDRLLIFPPPEMSAVGPPLQARPARRR